MRILVIGAGGVGGYFGGRLAKAGNELFFIARGEHLKAIQANGLHIESPDGDFSITPTAAARFAPIADLDLIMVCVKHHDLRETLPVVNRQVGANTIVISLLNGVDSEEVLMESVPRPHLAGALAYIGTAIAAPGRIRHTASGTITLGELEGKATPRIVKLKTAFLEAGIQCGTTDNFRKEMWGKLMWNVGFNGLSAITNRSAGELLDHQPTAEIVRKLMEELLQVAGRLGIEISPQLIDKHIEFTRGAGEIIPSMLQDVRHGRKTEIEIINGKTVNEGRKLGILTPYNETIQAAVSLMDTAARLCPP